MNVFKNVVITFGIIIVVVLVAGVVYVKTLDVNRHLPVITQEAQRLTGRVVSIKSASMDVSFSGGLELVLEGFFISEDEAIASKQPFIEVDRLAASLNWLKFLQRREISLGEIIIDSPAIKIIRLNTGEFNFVSIQQELEKSAADQGDVGKAKSASPLLFIDDIHIKDAQIIFDDQMAGMSPIEIKKLDIDIVKFSLLNPFETTISGAIFGEQKNFNVSLKSELHLSDQSVEIFDVKSSFKLEDALIPHLNSFGLADLKLTKPLSGDIELTLPQVSASSQGLSPWQADVIFKNVLISSDLAPKSIEALEGKIVLSAKDIVTNNLMFKYGVGDVKIQSVVENYMDPEVSSTSAKVDLINIEIAELPQVNLLPLKVSGKVNSQMTASFKGFEQQSIIDSAEINAGIDITKAIVENFNLLEKFVNALAIVPNLNEKLSTNLSPKWKEVLTKDHTIIDQINTGIALKQGILEIPRIDVEAEGFGVISDGKINLAQEFSLDTVVSVDQDLVKSMVASSDKVKLLMESDGAIRIPARVYGKLPNSIQFSLDEGYLGQKLMAYAAQEALGKIAEKNPEVGEVLNILFQKKPQNQAADNKQLAPAQEGESSAPSGSSQEAVEGLINSIFK